MKFSAERYRKSVFINCPFDTEYVEILHAITFAICFAQFIPRSALEETDSGEERLSRIVRIVKDCQFGIHDISRVELSGDGTDALPRFNMPFECGLFYGALEFGAKDQKAKKMLLLDRVKRQLDKTLSDISGKDPMVHNGDPLTAIACIRRFLADKIDGIHLPGEEFIQRVYQHFRTELPTLLHEFKLNGHEIVQLEYWKDYVKIVDTYLARRSPFEEISAAPG